MWLCDVTVTCVMSLLPVCCHCYLCDVTVTCVMSLLPVCCHCYLCDVTVTCVMSLLPVCCHCYLCVVTVTCVMSLLPVWCHCYLCDVTVTCVMSLLPVWCHCYLCVRWDVGWYSLQVEFITVDRPGQVIHRLWCVPGPYLTHTLQRAQHSATYRTQHKQNLYLKTNDLKTHLHTPVIPRPALFKTYDCYLPWLVPSSSAHSDDVMRLTRSTERTAGPMMHWAGGSAG